MNPKATKVTPQDDFTLLLTFSNGERKLFDVCPYLDRGIFVELKDMNYFKRVKPFFGGVGWPHEQDFGPDTLYVEGKVIADGLVTADE